MWEKSGNFVSLEKWEPWQTHPHTHTHTHTHKEQGEFVQQINVILNSIPENQLVRCISILNQIRKLEMPSKPASIVNGCNIWMRT